ncbi:bolA-like protein DDB_G0274169 [Andrena cerasifolii]|uniref:bolA-like protein DDB_G0274169 n=1 Tax=Andrena cerasifolii TaxID=2819439 RepID=UPI004038327D
MYKTKVLIGKSYRNILLSLKKMSTAIRNNPIEHSIREKLVNALNPSRIEIINESYMHNVPKGSETHFKVIVVSGMFENTARIKRHQMINNLLQAELEGGVHALSIVAKTRDEWDDNSKVSPSPACKGGFGR